HSNSSMPLHDALPISHLRRTIAPSLRGGWAEDWLDDVVDECVLDVLRALHSCRARNEGQLLAWLAAIKRRQLALLFRRESRSDRDRKSTRLNSSHVKI